MTEVVDIEFLQQLLTLQSFILLFIGIFAAIVGVMFGAAGFVMLPAMLVLGIPIHASIAVNKFATGFSSLTTMFSLIIRKEITIISMLPLMILSAVGGISGAFLATRLSEQAMNIIACIALILAFIAIIYPKRPHEKTRTSIVPAVFIGMYDGGLGPGSGSMYITYFLKRDEQYVSAAQKTRFLMFASCMSAFIFYLLYGIVDWSLAIPLTLGAIIGSHIAVKLMPNLNPKWMRIILPVIFIILIVQVIIEIL